MTKIIFAIAAATFHLPNADTFEDYSWQPQFTPPDELKLDQSTVAFFTHSSRHFDPLCLTQPAVNRVSEKMKAARLPTVYLHDQYNEKNPGWMYLYRDWKPTAFVGSDVGKIDIDVTAVRHAISLGGYFGQCQRSTVQDLIRCWRRDAAAENFRVTQIVDGIFCVGEYIKWEDPYRPEVRGLLYDDYRKRHPNSAICLAETLSHIRDQDLAIEFLCRQIPPLPGDVNIVIDFFGYDETIQVGPSNAPTLTIAYRRSDRFLKFHRATVRRDDIVNRSVRRSSTSTIIRSFRR